MGSDRRRRPGHVGGRRLQGARPQPNPPAGVRYPAGPFVQCRDSVGPLGRQPRPAQRCQQGHGRGNFPYPPTPTRDGSGWPAKLPHSHQVRRCTGAGRPMAPAQRNFDPGGIQRADNRGGPRRHSGPDDVSHRPESLRTGSGPAGGVGWVTCP